MRIIFALHLSGISSLLGAINFPFILRVYFLRFNYASYLNIFIKSKKKLKSTLDLNTNNRTISNELEATRLEPKMEPNKDPQKPKHSKHTGKTRHATDLKLKNNS